MLTWTVRSAALRKQGLDVRLTRVGDAELGVESRTAQANASGGYSGRVAA